MEEINKMTHRQVVRKSLKDYQINAGRTEYKFTQARELKEKEDSKGSILPKRLLS